MDFFGMTEQVTVTPQSGLDSDGDPIAAGVPVVLDAIAVAPGNTSFRVGDDSELDSAESTVYLPVGSPVSDDDLILVRGRACLARVQEWRDPWAGLEPLDGLVVLCKSVTGAS
jgi:hypothetical protein